jgi:hypothetical protein
MKDNISVEEYRKLAKTSAVSKKGRLIVEPESKPQGNRKIKNAVKSEVDGVKFDSSLDFNIEYVLPDLNTYIDAERSNRYIAAKLKKDATEEVEFACISKRNIVNPNCQYNVNIHWIVPTNKKDADNIFFGVKFILDGIVKAGVLNGDGRKNINNITHTIETIKNKYLINVQLNLAV